MEFQSSNDGLLRPGHVRVGHCARLVWSWHWMEAKYAWGYLRLCSTSIICMTRPKPPCERQGLAESWGKDTVRQVHFGVFSTSHFAPTVLSSDWIELNSTMEKRAKNVTLLIRGSIWPPLVQKRDVTDRGIHLTSFGAKNVTSPTGGSNWPFRCLDIILSSWTQQYTCDWRRVWRIMALKLTEEWRPWQRKSKLLSSWIILVAWAVHLRVDNKINLIQRAFWKCALSNLKKWARFGQPGRELNAATTNDCLCSTYRSPIWERVGKFFDNVFHWLVHLYQCQTNHLIRRGGEERNSQGFLANLKPGNYQLLLLRQNRWLRIILLQIQTLTLLPLVQWVARHITSRSNASNSGPT